MGGDKFTWCYVTVFLSGESYMLALSYWNLSLWAFFLVDQRLYVILISKRENTTTDSFCQATNLFQWFFHCPKRWGMFWRELPPHHGSQSLSMTMIFFYEVPPKFGQLPKVVQILIWWIIFLLLSFELEWRHIKEFCLIHLHSVSLLQDSTGNKAGVIIKWKGSGLQGDTNLASNLPMP